MKHQIYFIIFLLFSSTVTLAKSNYYRYKDKDGHVVITSTLPTDAAIFGYEILGSQGNVIETVPPQETQEKIVLDEKEIEKQKEEQKKAALQAQKDAILLKSFSSIEDIRRSRDEKIASIQVSMSIVQDNLKRLQKQLDENNASKLNYEKSGQKMPPTLQKTIEDTIRQMDESNAFVERKKKEIEGVHTKYQALEERFQQLQEKSKAKRGE